ncbi:hypothetical protein ACFSR9_15420 [Deinococcus taklimakanensis]|uniref:DUF4265 domain-containing protein n=1 Tax=Deinococcus taklimakanensis TaxID=536443 RepID=A0ABW5P972_9DEIO
MTPRENSFTFDLNPDAFATPLTVGDLALVRILDLRSPYDEYLWFEVLDASPNGLYRIRAVYAAEQFPEIPAGDVLYMRLEHVFAVVCAGADSGELGEAVAALGDKPAHRGWMDFE